MIVSGEGTRVTDDTGVDYLDAHGGAWLCQIGHGRREVADAVADQMLQLEHFGVGGPHANPRAIELAERIVRLGPRGASKVTFLSSGSEAVDEAVRLAREYHHRLGHRERHWVLSLQGGYHGRTLAGTALAGAGDDCGWGPVLPGFAQVPAPVRRFGGPATEAELVAHALTGLRRTVERIGPDRVAALFVEPVMGPAGMIPLPAAYWTGVREILAEHGILLVADEVVTGFGRTGHWFGSHLADLSPDLTVMAKGIASGYLPLAAILFGERTAAVLADADTGGSYGGHTAACAAGCASVDIIEREDLVGNAARVGARLLDRLGRLRELPVVGDVHGAGLMIGVELVADAETFAPPRVSPAAVVDVLRAQHRIIAGGAGNSVAITPPLTLSAEEADTVADALYDVLARVGPDGSIEGVK
ncbi:aminotransferase class III-fold pyridoxal phosphate-dependent enzyme [Streptomyces sp. VNUA24]|uniref:aminotransferase family protein n=1 Tax=Streptomyces sp. VNUA24 TaxID=3031131 RepID=UPI0023B81E8E|nr:aminotransferase class III-fold pyridoxal phosphate-dependent enzyme [Streptomyces sp. VNUA24]WEH12857.1 aminotransferase class III-fold pyridoxal phosphate-dependent enzyme [Streptomyces sp. VNUA24]